MNVTDVGLSCVASDGSAQAVTGTFALSVTDVVAGVPNPLAMALIGITQAPTTSVMVVVMREVVDIEFALDATLISATNAHNFYSYSMV